MRLGEHLSKVQIKQNKLLRAILGIRTTDYIPDVHTADKYKLTNISSVKNLFKFYLFKFLVHVIQGRMPYFYSTLLLQFEVHHKYNAQKLCGRGVRILPP